MIGKLIFGVVLVFSAIALLSNRVVAEDSKGTDDLFERDAFASIEQVATGDLKATFDLGVCPAGKKVKAFLTLQNPSDFDLPVKGMSTSCSCLKAVTDAEVIKAGGAAEIDVSLDIPKASKTPEQYLDMYLSYGPEKKIHIQIAYELSGLVSFTGNGFSTNAPFKATVHRFRVPVVVTRPALLSNLKFETRELGEVMCRGIEEAGQQYIECDTQIDGTTRIGSISIFDPTTENTGSITVIVNATSPIAIAPQILRFQPDPGKPSEYIASAIVRLAEETLAIRKDGRSDVELEAPPLITWSSESASVGADLKRLSKGTYRAMFRVVVSQPENGSKESPVFPKGFTAVYKTKLGVFTKELKTIFSN